MGKYYIFIIEKRVKAFSIIGHGNECSFSLSLKNQINPFEPLDSEDKIIGYISNEEKRFSYIFSVKNNISTNECIMVKKFESVSGPTIDKLSPGIQKRVFEKENTESLIQITEEEYTEIVNLMMNECIIHFTNDSKRSNSENEMVDNNSSSECKGCNIILYGVPGCGKSHKIKKDYCHDEERIERVVFHPDYTYSDFVGQILPVINSEGRISYDFHSGPFTSILKKAFENPDKMFYLIIEEINRGNAPAIFGDVFQLLDRDDDGNSTYTVSNSEISKKVFGNDNKKIYIPNNLTVLATMNTADQNVFTLDTAFKRRWQMKHIANNINECIFADKKICGQEVTWREFVTKINDVIVEKANDAIGIEDKRLGAFFVNEKEIEDSELFADKILMYLWNDVFKYNREEVFDSSYDTLDMLIDGFMCKYFDVFNDSIGLNAISVQDNIENEEVTENDDSDIPDEE